MNIYFVCGENFIERREFGESVFANSTNTENPYKILSGDSLTAVDIITELESGGGLFATELNIWIKQFDFFIYKNPTGKSKTYTKNFDEFLQYAQSQISSLDGNLVLECSLPASDKASKQFAKIKANVKEFKLPYPSGYAKWIRERASKKYNLMLNDTAIRFLEHSCSSPFEMDKEIEKLDIYMPEDNRRVEGEDIINIVGAHKIAGVNDLWMSLITRNKGLTIKTLRNIIQNGSTSDKSMIMWFLFSHFRKIFIVASSSHLDDASLGSKIGYFGNRLFMMKNERVRENVSTNYAPFEVLEIISKLAETDFAIKEGLKGSEEAIENFIFEVL